MGPPRVTESGQPGPEELLSGPPMGLCAQAGALHRPLLLVALVTALGSVLLWASRRHLLLWLERQEPRVGILLFTLAFTLISFPWSWGYTLLSLAPGYLYGFQRGLVVVALGVAVGTLLAHLVTKRCLLAYMTAQVRGNAKLSAIIRVLDGTSGLKVVFLARLTPIPFGLQNAVFSIFISVAMMLYFVRRARQELNKTIEAHNANQPDGEPLPDIQKDTCSTKRINVPLEMDLV
ncbi:transmembrane protein 64-like isoform X2 [Scyliorhinus canicula]|uniref:transmembrane protein 64-like isoform X2 n=1 Tax=Scyliorhinus canicula TaxID=7830 RepID=UPI0018F7C1AA|nr:transmembrane protein 64-like isoform X2 [Scyliorhinus canicula]